MRVFRLENSYGTGPYHVPEYSRGFLLFTDLSSYPSYIRMYEYCDAHPTPEEDGMSNFYDMLFGFDSIDSFKAWFFLDDLDPVRLDIMNFVLVELEVPTQYVSIGTRQLAFQRNAASLVTTHILTDIS